MLTGHIDGLTRVGTRGWVRDTAYPDSPVSVLITCGHRLLGRAVANIPRPDLVAAGIGDGAFSFSLSFNPPLSPARSWLIHLRSEATGAELPGSPIRLPAAKEFDPAARRAFSAAIDSFASEAELDERLTFLATERDRLLQRRADNRGNRFDRDRPNAEHASRPRRVLVIDHRPPRSDHDGGSSAILSHMRALRRLGYHVVFAAQSMAAPEGADAALLDRDGIESCHAPHYASVEEVLRRDSGMFDVVYLHRVSIAAAYTALVRQTQPRARLVYSVADLHHVRLHRQAKYEDWLELTAEADRVRDQELWCARMADAVITHSSTEATLLRPMLPAGRVHVVAWDMPIRPGPRTFDQRVGAAFIGHFAHAPNAAAAWVLRDQIVPALQRCTPPIDCVLVGDGVPPSLGLPRPGLTSAGHVACLDDVLGNVRLTLALVPFGAGLKGKVLASFQAGVPCVCSPVAAEGFDLPPRLQDLVVRDTEAAIRLIARLHGDADYHGRLSKRCRLFAERRFSEAALDAALATAVRRPVAQT